MYQPSCVGRYTRTHISTICVCVCVCLFTEVFSEMKEYYICSQTREVQVLYMQMTYTYTHTPLSVVHISLSDLCLHTPASLQKQSILTQISLCSYQRTLNSACSYPSRTTGCADYNLVLVSSHVLNLQLSQQCQISLKD